MFPIIPLAMAAYGIFSAESEKKKKAEADKKAQASIAARPDYQISETSKAQLADAQSHLNSVSPGLLAAYQQAQQGAANQMGNAERNASSGAQALAVGAGAQSQMQNILPQLAQQQDQYNQQNRQLYYGALNNMDQQHNQQFDSQLGKYSDLTNFYLGQVGAHSANQSQAMSLAASGLASAAGNVGGNGNLFGGARMKNIAPLGQLNQSPMQQMPIGSINPQMQPMQMNQVQYPQRYNPLYSSWLGM